MLRLTMLDLTKRAIVDQEVGQDLIIGY